MSYQSKFADALRATMEKKKISQATVARLTSVNSGTISRVLSGKKKVSYETIATIAYKLDMWKGRTPDDLVKLNEELTCKYYTIVRKLHNTTISQLLMVIALIVGGIACLLK